MDEARRFLRQFTPGGIFLVECSLLLALAAPEWVSHVIGKLGKIDSAVPLITGLVGLPLFGVILSNLHHAMLGIRFYSDTLGMRPDQRAVLTELSSRQGAGGGLAFDIVPTGTVASRTNSKSARKGFSRDPARWSTGAAAIVTTVLWHERLETSPVIKGANPRNNSINDVMHGLCAGYVGAVCAVGAAAGISCLNAIGGFAFIVQASDAREQANLVPIWVFLSATLGLLLSLIANAIRVVRKNDLSGNGIKCLCVCSVLGICVVFCFVTWASQDPRWAGFFEVSLFGTCLIGLHQAAAHRLIREHECQVFSWLINASALETTVGLTSPLTPTIETAQTPPAPTSQLPRKEILSSDLFEGEIVVSDSRDERPAEIECANPTRAAD
jgi:hypothetical protein